MTNPNGRPGRMAGYYWVLPKECQDWTVAYWNCRCWYVTASMTPSFDVDMQEIDENIILPRNK